MKFLVVNYQDAESEVVDCSTTWAVEKEGMLLLGEHSEHVSADGDMQGGRESKQSLCSAPTRKSWANKTTGETSSYCAWDAGLSCMGERGDFHQMKINQTTLLGVV